MPSAVATPADLTPARKPYAPRGSALRLLRDRSAEVLLSGPAGTGKTRANLEKLHACAKKYPGMRGLIVRKTRASLTESALVTFETHVVEEGHACLTGATRPCRQAYHYPNGSVLVCGGMDKASRTLSTEYDMVYVPEAIELTEDDWEMLTRPLRHNKMPFQQLIADTNPDRPSHWLKKRCDAGRTAMIDARHEDNPILWDEAARAWTPMGAAYIAKLDALTGPRKARLRHGRWVQAEGVVYEGWEPGRHLIDPLEVPADWPRWWIVDFGFTHPFVCLWVARDPDGRLYVYRELHRTGMLVEDAAREILALSRDEPRPQAVVCDHDAEGRATLERHLNIPTAPARKEVSVGIQAVAARLRPAGDGKPRLFVLRDSLVERDPALDDRKKPCCLAEEMDAYVWNTAAGRARGEEPVKEDDDACDCLRYAVAELDCGQPIGDFVWLKTRPDPAPLLPPEPQALRYADAMRYFPPSGTYQPWLDRDGARIWLCDFKSEDQAAHALCVARELLGMPPPAFARPTLEPAEVAKVEKRLRDFLVKAHLI